MSASDYQAFLGTKRRHWYGEGITPGEVNAHLFPWQAAIVRWALRKGRAAIFADCGLGKTLMQLAWAQALGVRTLILTPLCKKTERPVIVCTEYRGIFFGYAGDTSGDTIHLHGAKMAIYWGTTRGVLELAHTGPTSRSKISLPADIEVRKVTSVFEVTPAAREAWDNA